MATKKETEAPEPVDPNAPGELTKAKDLKAATVTTAPEKGRTVRITALGRNDYSFKGVRFTKDGQHVDPKDLKWSEADWAAAHADPVLAIEEFDDGKLVSKADMLTAGRNHGPKAEEQ